jgi:hypothetical protein
VIFFESQPQKSSRRGARLCAQCKIYRCDKQNDKPLKTICKSKILIEEQIRLRVGTTHQSNISPLLGFTSYYFAEASYNPTYDQLLHPIFEAGWEHRGTLPAED